MSRMRPKHHRRMYSLCTMRNRGSYGTSCRSGSAWAGSCADLGSFGQTSGLSASAFDGAFVMG